MITQWFLLFKKKLLSDPTLWQSINMSLCCSHWYLFSEMWVQKILLLEKIAHILLWVWCWITGISRDGWGKIVWTLFLNMWQLKRWTESSHLNVTFMSLSNINDQQRKYSMDRENDKCTFKRGMTLSVLKEVMVQSSSGNKFSYPKQFSITS